MKLSVIVPVYNVEKFLPRCLDSLLRQGIERGMYEVICVNDGSPDNSAQVLIDYESKNPDVFKVITQDNQGVSVARNRGLAIAQGEWIAFVDPDDYVVDDAYKYLLEHFGKENVDVVAFGYHYVYTDGIERPYAGDAIKGHVVYDGDGAEYHNTHELPYTWSKLYRRQFLHAYDLSFTPIYMEDLLFNFQLFCCNPHIICTDYKAYGYEKDNATSLMHQSEKKKVLKQLDGILYGAEFLNNYLDGEDAKMAPAALRGISIYIDHFYRKLFRVRLNRKEWKALFQRFEQMPIHQARETAITPPVIAMLKNVAGSSYVNYFIISNLYRVFIFKNNHSKTYGKKTNNRFCGTMGG